MAYGDYDGPNKPNKGHEGGACNRTRCQAEPALWWNHGSHSWYCEDCKRDIGDDHVNRRGWELRFQPECGHPQFETREQMDARKEARAPREPAVSVYRLEPPPRLSLRSFVPIDNRKGWVKANDAPKRPRR